MTLAAPVARKPRLTDALLDDLPEALATLQADIEYLRESVPSYPKGSAIAERFAKRLRALERSHAWLEGTRTAVIAQRQQGLTDEDE